jgi:hypothetical protein
MHHGRWRRCIDLGLHALRARFIAATAARAYHFGESGGVTAMRGFKAMTAAVAIAVTVTSAAPAFADGPGRWRHYRHHDRGLDAGALIGGLALVGAAAVVIGSVNAQNREQRYDDDRYAPPPPPREQGWQDDDGGYRDGSYPDDGGFDPAAVRTEDQAVDACSVAAENQGREHASNARVTDIVDIDRDSRGWVVDGTVELRDGYRDASTRQERFRCAVTFDGLRDVRIAGLDDRFR